MTYSATAPAEAPVMELCFPLTGERVPLDHGYPLYAALSRAVPQLHGARFGVHPLSGQPDGDGGLHLHPRSNLWLRLPLTLIPTATRLAGAKLDIDGHPIRLGPPNIQAILPAPSLDARRVFIKLTHVPRAGGAIDKDALRTGFSEAMSKQLQALDIHKPFELTGLSQMTIKGQRLLGFSARVTDLNAEESLRLQAHGVGGKRAMGCGIFRATRQ